MLFEYAQIVPIIMYAPTLPIMLKLCPLFLEGAELYVQIIKAITLLCTTSQLHHKSQIRPRRLLGDLPRLHGPCTCTVPLATCHVRTLPLGPGPQAWGPDTSQSGMGHS